jgi:hypothetical protein
MQTITTIGLDIARAGPAGRWPSRAGSFGWGRPVEPNVRLRDVWLVQSVERYAQRPWLAPNNVAVLAEMTISHKQCNLMRN